MSFGPLVWVLDASAIIHCKRMIRVASQWSFFLCLEAMVANGEVVFPERVMDELGRVQHPDVPGAWAYGCGRQVKWAFNPNEKTLVHVMRVAGEVVDPPDPETDADPYVIAQALDIRAMGRDVMIVTRDSHDRRDHVSIVTACARPGISVDTCNLVDFVDAIDCDAGVLRADT